MSRAFQNTIIKLHFITYFPSYGAWKLQYRRRYPYTHAHLRVYPHCLTYAHAHKIESNPSQLNDSNFLFFFFHIAFSFNFFTLVGFFKSFFKMAAYSSNEIVDIILVLDEARRNYCRAERLYRNRYSFRRHPHAMQIRRILLREHRRIWEIASI